MVKTASFRRALPLCLIVLLAQAFSCEAPIKMGRRRIKCTAPIGGKSSEPSLYYWVRGISGIFAEPRQVPRARADPTPMVQQKLECRRRHPSPPSITIWLPPHRAWRSSALQCHGLLASTKNRLLVTKKGLGMSPVSSELKDIKDWFMTPAGLVVKSSETKFYPLAWDLKSLECLLEDRIPN